MKMTIIKAQLPVTQGGEPAVLIYNKDRSLEMMVTSQSFKEMIESELDGELQGYFQAEVEGRDVTLGKRVGKQKW